MCVYVCVCVIIREMFNGGDVNYRRGLLRNVYPLAPLFIEQYLKHGARGSRAVKINLRCLPYLPPSAAPPAPRSAPRRGLCKIAAPLRLDKVHVCRAWKYADARDLRKYSVLDEKTGRWK